EGDGEHYRALRADRGGCQRGQEPSGQPPQAAESARGDQATPPGPAAATPDPAGTRARRPPPPAQAQSRAERGTPRTQAGAQLLDEPAGRQKGAEAADDQPDPFVHALDHGDDTCGP